jgi:hypothetical protein
MTEQFTFSQDKAHAIGETIGIDWSTSRFDVAQFQKGAGLLEGLYVVWGMTPRA